MGKDPENEEDLQIIVKVIEGFIIKCCEREKSLMEVNDKLDDLKYEVKDYI